MPRKSRKKTKKKGGTSRKYRSASPMNQQRSKISKSKRSYVNNQLKKISSKRKKYSRTLRDSKNRSKYGSHIKKQLIKLDDREDKFRRQLPVSHSRRNVKSASARAPSRSHRQSDLYLMRQKNLQRRPNETQKKYEMRMRRRRSARNVSRIARRPASPIFD